ncbi:type II secretion system protein N [Comamonas flocculans]|uniref:General secretion pathway protein C n=1 Tax=Comamonas flocculans TaxID=2597701 RepID=A0A5B8RYS8_9BURK|nr:type II secretion system protein N [Comamonas flocculans]QEA13375.1 general secretion pathway protein C [Comamonas flocculans]
MSAPARHPWSLRLATLGLWLLCGASLAWWAIRLARAPAVAPVPVAAAEPPAVDAAALARLLGASPAVVSDAAEPESAHLVLRGVLAGTRSGQGAALIAVGDKPAKPYRVGAQVAPGLVVQSLGAREARLGAALDGAATMTLELPRPSPSLSPSPPGRGKG